MSHSRSKLARALETVIDLRRQLAAATASTPSSTWAAEGEPDPHGDRYSCERAELALGHLTDDQLANGAFMNYDRPLDLDAVMRREPDYHSPIAWMTAVKDRIRWLSRKLAEQSTCSCRTPEAAETRRKDSAEAVDLQRILFERHRDCRPADVGLMGWAAAVLSAQSDLWAVHAQGPDELYAAFSREDADQHAAALNALSMPDGIQVAAVVVPSPWSAAEHWKYAAELERDHASELKALAAWPAPHLLIGALERVAREPGCGCVGPCACGGEERAQIELEGRREIAAKALEKYRAIAGAQGGAR